MTKQSSADMLDVITRAIAAWKSVDPDLEAHGASVGDLEALLEQSQDLQRQIDTHLAQLTSMRNQRDAIHKTARDQIKHLRMVVKGLYGGDSSQYEMVGGTRLSERKPWRRRAKPTILES